MLIRAISGSVYVAIVVASAIFGGWMLHIVFGVFTALMLYEFANMFRHSDYAPNSVLVTVVGTLIYGLAVVPIHYMKHFYHLYEGSYWMLTLGAFFLSITSVIIFGVFEISSPTKKPIANTALSVAGIVYIVPAMILVNLLSAMGPEEVNTFPLLGIFIMIWCSDTFAYLVGKQFGKSPMAKTISPNKTWEGFAGGLIFTIIAGLVIAYFQKGQPFLAYGVLAVFVAGFGLFGDLFESKIKRQLNLKDSGKIIPGHGGILDRFDSVLFVVPVAFLVVFVFMFLW